MAVKRKVLQAHFVHRKDTWSADSRTELSLAPGTPGYVEYLRDHAGVTDSDFVSTGALLDLGKDKRPDEAQTPITEPEHVESLAGDLREKARKDMSAVTATSQKQVRLQRAKEAQFPIVKERAIRAAEQTPGMADDRRAHSADVDDIPEPKYNDGISEDEYVPAALSRFL